MRCLIVEHDSLYARKLIKAFESRNMRLDFAHAGNDAEMKLEDVGYHAMILSTDMPTLTSVQFLRQLRSDKWDLPIIMVSREENAALRIAAFEAGADDCVTRNVDPDELIARIHNVLRRQHSHSSPVIKIGELVIRLNSKTVEVNGAKVDLARKEYQTLELLALRKGRNVTKDQLHENLYGSMDERDQKIIDVYICKLRKKLSAASGGTQYIKTVWGEGFILEDPAGELTKLCA